MKKLGLFAALVLACMLSACGQPVKAGYVGVKAYLYGGDKGLQAEQVGPGRYMVGLNEELYIYPTFTQTSVFCTDSADGSYFTFQTKDGASVSACIGMSSYAEANRAVDLLKKFRAVDEEPFDNILGTWVRQRIADELASQAINYTAFELLQKRIELLDAVQTSVAKEAAAVGIVIEKLSWIGNINYPPNVQAAINNTLESVQNAERARQDLLTAEAQSKVTIVEAQAKADAIRIQAEAIAKNPSVLQLKAIEKWDGALPQVTSGGTPFVQLNGASK